MNFRKIEKLIIQDGWYLVNQKGSHCQYRHPVKTGKVTIPKHTGDLNIDTIKSILKQAQLSSDCNC